MKNVIKVWLVTGLLVIGFMTNVYATEGIKTTTEEVTQSDENAFLSSIDQEYTEENEKYKLSNYFKEEDDNNTKSVSVYKSDILKSNTKESIMEHFGEYFKYEDDEYYGTIEMKDYEVRAISNGTYEEIDEQVIDFNGYSKNDLDNIEKEKIINGIRYYLINVRWENDVVENLDNQEVPVSYKGKMIYQAVVQKNYPNDYEIKVKYEGNVTKKNPIYVYTIEYKKVEEQPVEEKEEPIEEDKKSSIDETVISGLGLAIITIYLINSRTAKVYCKTKNGYKFIKLVGISKKHNQINLGNLEHKITTNMYAIKISNSFYRKNKNMVIKVKKDRILKNVYLNSRFVDFIIG